MSDNTTQFKRFKQIPTWDPKAKFHLTGEEFLELKQFFDMFARPLFYTEQIFERHLNSGTITMRYEDEDGNEMSKEEVQKIVEDYEKQLMKKAEE